MKAKPITLDEIYVQTKRMKEAAKNGEFNLADVARVIDDPSDIENIDDDFLEKNVDIGVKQTRVKGKKKKDDEQLELGGDMRRQALVRSAIQTMKVIIDDESTRVSRVQIKIIEAKLKDVKSKLSPQDREEYRKRLASLKTSVNYRDSVMESCKEERSRAAYAEIRNNKEITAKMKEYTALKASSKNYTAGHIYRLFKDYKKRFEDKAYVDGVYDFDKDTENTKELGIQLVDFINKTEVETIADVNIEDDDRTLNEKLISCIFLISLVTDVNAVNVYKMDLKQVKQLIENSIKKFDMEKDMSSKLKKLEMEINMMKSKIYKDMLPDFIRKEMDLKTQRGITKSKDLLISSVQSFFMALAYVMCRSRNMPLDTAADIAAAANVRICDPETDKNGNIVGPSLIDQYLEHIQTEEYAELSFVAFISEKVYYQMKAAASQLRSMGTHSTSAEIYSIKENERDFGKFLKDNPEAAKLPDEHKVELYRAYLRNIGDEKRADSIVTMDDIKGMSRGNKKTTFSDMESVIGGTGEVVNAANFIPDNDPIPDDITDANLKKQILKDEWIMFFNQIVFLPRLKFDSRGYMLSKKKTYVNATELEALMKRMGLIRKVDEKGKLIGDGYYRSWSEIAPTIVNKSRGGSDEGVRDGSLSYMFNRSKNGSFFEKIDGKRSDSLVNDYTKAAELDPRHRKMFMRYVHIAKKVCYILDRLIRDYDDDGNKMGSKKVDNNDQLISLGLIIGDFEFKNDLPKFLKP